MVSTFDLHFVCPDINTQQDEMLVHEALSAAPGVGMVEVDYRTGDVHVVTANQDGGVDVVDRLDRAGYPVQLIG